MDALDVDNRVVFSADDHLGDGGGSKGSAILEWHGEDRGVGKGRGTHLVAEAAHSGAKGMLDDLEGVVSGRG